MRSFFKSLKYAVKGLVRITKSELNFRLELLVAVVVIILIIIFPLARWEQILMILMIAAVLVLEVLNTAFERISDAMKPRLSPVVKEVKDLMAGAVLLTSITAVVVALMIFPSYLFQ